ncbi:hypothetical protein ACIPUC_24095 [Streptomyces sp. LARHCF249]
MARRTAAGGLPVVPAVQRSAAATAAPAAPAAPAAMNVRAQAPEPQAAVQRKAAATTVELSGTPSAMPTGAVGPAAATHDPARPPAALPDALLDSLERRHLDDLARRLAEPIGRMLRAELRTGRERAGRLLDGGR